MEASIAQPTDDRCCAPTCTACGRRSPAAGREHADYVDARGAA